MVPLSESDHIALAAAVAAALSAVVAVAALVLTVWKDIIRDRPKLEVGAFFAPGGNGELRLFMSAVNTGRRPISVRGWIITLRDGRKCLLGLTNSILNEAETWSHDMDVSSVVMPEEVADIFCNDVTGKEWHVPKKSLNGLRKIFPALRFT